MRAVIIIVIILAVIAALAVDGFGMYVAHRTAVEVAAGAAKQAAQTYVVSKGNEQAAEQVVKAIAEEARAQLVAVDYHKATARWYEVTIRTEPRSYFLKHLPVLKDYLAQESTAVVHF